jgi:hypothetical protein
MEIRTETEIEAPPSAVWSVLSDFERYPEWNPFIVAIRGELAAGARLFATLSLPDSAAEHRIRPLVIRCEPERELRWLEHLWMKGLYDGEHFFRLEERDGRTRFIHGQDISGLLVRFAMNTVTHSTRGFAYMNQALKQRVESGKASRPVGD